MGPVFIVSELVASVQQVPVDGGDVVTSGSTVGLLESMKMEIPVLTDQPGQVLDVRVAPGDVVQEGDVLVVVEPAG